MPVTLDVTPNESTLKVLARESNGSTSDATWLA
ncbi:MAG: hypothetical protein ACJA16_004518 [Akkermansiaceae bacterium]|jgi:hypothetical protein